MKRYLVKDLMVPISEYATVSLGSTLSEAVSALEKAQEDYNHTHYRHRAVLVLDNNKQVVGKLSQLDFLRSLEPQDEQIERIKEIRKFGFSSKSIALQQEQYRQKMPDRTDIYAKATRSRSLCKPLQRVNLSMKTPPLKRRCISWLPDAIYRCW
jgi:hypothetical protein